jgi:hypothetical protein
MEAHRLGLPGDLNQVSTRVTLVSVDDAGRKRSIRGHLSLSQSGKFDRNR